MKTIREKRRMGKLKSIYLHSFELFFVGIVFKISWNFNFLSNIIFVTDGLNFNYDKAPTQNLLF